MEPYLCEAFKMSNSVVPTGCVTVFDEEPALYRLIDGRKLGERSVMPVYDDERSCTRHTGCQAASATAPAACEAFLLNTPSDDMIGLHKDTCQLRYLQRRTGFHLGLTTTILLRHIISHPKS